MDRATLLADLAEVERTHGPWHSHNVALPYGVFTLGPEPTGDNYRAVKFVRLAADLLRRPLSDLRVLDLGCGEGLYALEFAQHGAQTLGIESRDYHLARAEFARRALRLDNARFVQGDVRQVTPETFGRFDVVLCSGILYHLDTPDVFHLIRQLRAVTSGLCVIDTSTSLSPDVEVEFEGRSYRGSFYEEHAVGLSEADKLRAAGASIDNERSFWIAKHDIVNALMDVGFSSVLECLAPLPYMLRNGRVTLAAMAGPPVTAFQQIGPDVLEKRWPARWGLQAFPEPPPTWGAMQHGSR